MKMTKPPWELRIMTQFDEGLITDLPIVRTGSLKSLETYCKNCGFRFRQDNNYLVGGYFVHDETGDCYFVT